MVFIGPCISKKDEAERYGQVDCVLTFDELIDWLAEEGIELPSGEPDGTEARSRFFPTAGGIIRSMDLDDGFSYIPIDGLRPVHVALEEIERGGMQNCFVEMSACEGSCIGGPVMHRYHSSPSPARPGWSGTAARAAGTLTISPPAACTSRSSTSAPGR